LRAINAADMRTCDFTWGGSVVNFLGRLVPLLSACVLSVLLGLAIAYTDSFPYPHVRNAFKTLETAVEYTRRSSRPYAGKWIGAVDFPAAEAPARRWNIIDPSAPRLPVYVFGGLNHFRELCPDGGCAAVEFGSDGKAVRSWPYRPNEIFAADTVARQFPREYLWFDPVRDIYPAGMRKLPDDSMAIVFQAQGDSIFPFGMGVARIAHNGLPVWTRFDYTHHWPNLDSRGRLLLPGMALGEGALRVSIGTPPDEHWMRVRCSNQRYHIDQVSIVEQDGRVAENIDLVELFVGTNWSLLLADTTNGCDPLHLNFIHEAGPDAGPGLLPGDLVVSLRNLSAFAILDGGTKAIKRVVSGSFIAQHAVTHLSGSKFVMFDNRGGDVFGPGSRILEVDIATGQERRIFPNENTPEEWRSQYSETAGHIDISPDRTRLIASFTHEGRAFEMDIATGRLLAVYDHVHDLLGVDGRPDEEHGTATRFSLYGVGYVKP
jgi:hypothetical protein